jgi:hypothetical protein
MLKLFLLALLIGASLAVIFGLASSISQKLNNKQTPLRSNNLMILRVVLQAIAITIVSIIYYMSKK